MEAFASAGPDRSPSPKRRPRLGFLRFERWVCNVVTYFPLAFVYALTSWAAWVQARVGFQVTQDGLFGKPIATLGIIFYLLLNISYTVAVFTDPGSPLLSQSSRRGYQRHEYSHLPTTETPQNSLTVSSTGAPRFCKKCQGPKPDRAHHCSTCKRCVLKMDHHCPWLSTCVGLHNYKPFLLFLIYTCFFCCACELVTARWIWNEMLTTRIHVERGLPINAVMLAVIALLIGLVLMGFTGWHISLAMRGMTTIECLEKTRYIAPIRRTLDRQRLGMHAGGPPPPATPTPGVDNNNGGFRQTLQGYGQQFIDAHANAIPSVTRAEEGEERPSPVQGSHHLPPGAYDPNERMDSYNSPAQQSLLHSYEALEEARDHDRYQEYLDERDSEKLPHAFNLGWRRNLSHLFGPNPWLRGLPVPNTTGDGWHWEASAEWVQAKQRIDQQRIDRWESDQRRQQELLRRHHAAAQQQGGGYQQTVVPHTNSGPRNIVQHNHSLHDANERPATGVSMKTLAPMSPRPRPGAGGGMDLDDDYDDDGNRASTAARGARESADEWRDWD